jgi:GAF domain-containing protein
MYTTAALVPQTTSRQALLEGQREILAAIASEKPLPDILELICRIIEAQSVGLMCSILLLDESNQHLLHGAAPSLPADYCALVNGACIGPNIGSCGAAAHSGEPVIVDDISTHPNWAPIRDIAYGRFGLRACWSTPIRRYDGRVVATFAMYYREPRKPTLHERKLIDFSSHLVAIAVNRHAERTELGTL